jgi:hydroxymethylpyrimidine pyrophosphatase-like HAD family hydrolase
MTARTSSARIRAIFVDVDGTLVGAVNSVSPAVRAAVCAARDRGCEIVVCTGRSRFTAEGVAEQLGEPGYLVTLNGSVALHLGTNEVLVREVLSIETALRAIRAMISLDAQVYVYEDALLPDPEQARVLYHPDLPIGPWAVPPRYRPYPGITEGLPYEPVCVNAYGPREQIRQVSKALRAMLGPEIDLIHTGTARYDGVEAFASGVSKMRGAAVVAERLGVAPEEILAIGDHANDVEMLAWAGIGVAMGNALPEVKEAANWVTADLEADGVARAIEKFVLAPA